MKSILLLICAFAAGAGGPTQAPPPPVPASTHEAAGHARSTENADANTPDSDDGADDGDESDGGESNGESGETKITGKYEKCTRSKAEIRHIKDKSVCYYTGPYFCNAPVSGGAQATFAIHYSVCKPVQGSKCPNTTDCANSTAYSISEMKHDLQPPARSEYCPTDSAESAETPARQTGSARTTPAAREHYEDALPEGTQKARR